MQEELNIRRRIELRIDVVGLPLYKPTYVIAILESRSCEDPRRGIGDDPVVVGREAPVHDAG